MNFFPLLLLIPQLTSFLKSLFSDFHPQSSPSFNFDPFGPPSNSIWTSPLSYFKIPLSLIFHSLTNWMKKWLIRLKAAIVATTRSGKGKWSSNSSQHWKFSLICWLISHFIDWFYRPIHHFIERLSTTHLLHLFFWLSDSNNRLFEQYMYVYLYSWKYVKWKWIEPKTFAHPMMLFFLNNQCFGYSSC